MEEVLTLVCPHGADIFVSAMQIDPPTFAAIRVETMLERCPKCGHASWFQKGDYSFRSS
jgi:hypothetical protein